jgi:hypothetical protein
MQTTLNRIRANGPCGIKPQPDGTLTGYLKLRAYVGEDYDPDAPIDLLMILDSNGLNDALWCLRAVDVPERDIRRYALACARRVEHLDKSGAATRCNDVHERWLAGDATDEELEAARDAAWAARDAAWGAAWDAAEDAEDAERDYQTRLLKAWCETGDIQKAIEEMDNE